MDWCVEHAPQHPTCQSKAVRPVALSDPPPPSFVGSSQNRAALSLDSEKSSRVPCQVSVESARSRSWVSDRASFGCGMGMTYPYQDGCGGVAGGTSPVPCPTPVAVGATSGLCPLIVVRPNKKGSTRVLQREVFARVFCIPWHTADGWGPDSG